MENIKLQEIIDLLKKTEKNCDKLIKKETDDTAMLIHIGSRSMVIALKMFMKEAQEKDSLQEVADEYIEHRQNVKDIKESIGWD